MRFTLWTARETGAIKLFSYKAICFMRLDIRYYLGFVDIFTTYGFRQKLGHCFKTLKFCGNHHSSANAEVYSERLQEFLEDHLP